MGIPAGYFRYFGVEGIFMAVHGILLGHFLPGIRPNADNAKKGQKMLQKQAEKHPENAPETLR